jgi:hypothetical protein
VLPALLLLSSCDRPSLQLPMHCCRAGAAALRLAELLAAAHTAAAAADVELLPGLPDVLAAADPAGQQNGYDCQRRASSGCTMCLSSM